MYTILSYVGVREDSVHLVYTHFSVGSVLTNNARAELAAETAKTKNEHKVAITTADCSRPMASNTLSAGKTRLHNAFFCSL